MKNDISKKEFEIAEKRMNELLAIATNKGGFEFLSAKENSALSKYTKIVKAFEDAN
jgi:hypothetical protein